MTIAADLQAHARAVRARLWRPPNAVPDRGFENGKAVKAALAERMQQNIIEHLQLVEHDRRDKSIRKAERRILWEQK